MSTLHKEAQGKQLRLRIRIENITIALLAVFSLFLFILTFFPFSKISQTMQVSFEMGRMVQRAFSIILFVFPCSYGRGNETHGLLPCLSLS